jgi:23S rRNA (uracil1939-C5)-methyltransferase
MADRRGRPPRAPGRGRPAARRAPAPAFGPPTEVAVTGIAAGGDGVARVGGMVAFVPRTAPGDVARVRLAPGDRFARGLLDEVVAPGPGRVEPPCPHYVVDRCGGCQLQHLAYDAQLDAKRVIVGDALARIGRLAADVAAVEASPRPWRYRRKLTLALRRRGGRWIGGLHPYDAPGDVFALGDCPITDERVVATWRAVLAAAEHLPRDVPALRGAVRLVGDSDADAARAAFALEGGRAWPEAEALADAVPALAALWHTPDGGRRRLVVDRRGDALPGASFAQVNPAMAAELGRAVVDAALAFAPARVVDGYAGAGDTAAALAAHGVHATAIELDAEAARYAADRLGGAGRSVVGRVEDELPGALPADVVVLNPPRAGLDPRVPETLERAAAGEYGAPPRGLVYVSCNPATLARDLARLPSYRVRTVRPFDMFPQTAHVETLVVAERAGDHP